MKRATLMVLFVMLAGSCGWAQEERSPLVFDIGLRIWGADIGVGYRGIALVPGVDTTFWAYAGGGYQDVSFYREPAGELVEPGALGSRDPAFTRIEGLWKAGMAQGLVWNSRIEANLLEAFAFYRGRYDVNQAEAGSLLAATSISVLPDRDGSLLNSILAGLAMNDLRFETKHKVYDGTSAEVSAEWGPGAVGWLRFNGTFRWFVPLYDVAPDRPVNLFSVYLAGFVAADYALGLGGPVPLQVRRSLGGRDMINGLGGALRGVDATSADTNFKAVNNLEVRMNLPALFLPDLVPGIVVFWDAGYYDQVGEPGVARPGSGFVTSTGAGISLNLLDIATLVGYVQYRLDAPNANRQYLTPFALEFGLHF
jgi:hypothetical protein